MSQITEFKLDPRDGTATFERANGAVESFNLSNTVIRNPDTGVLQTPGGEMVGAVVGTTVSLIGDSRTQDYYISNRRTGGRSWIAWANAFMGCPLRVIAEYATSGQRSDQYFAEANFAQMLSDSAEIAIVGYPFVNDISQASGGYTDVDGNVITTANLLPIIMRRHRDRVARLVAAGKQVIVCTEPGASSLGSAAVGLVHQVNAAIRSSYRATRGVFLFDPVNLIWSRATSDTAIVFQAGFSGDGTHATTRQGHVVGRFAVEDLFKVPVGSRKSYGVNQATARQIYPNTGYATTTGGVLTNITGTGPVPANTEVRAPTANGSTYSSSVAPSTDGSGNEWTITINAPTAGLYRIAHTGASIAGLLYTDQFVGGLDVDVVICQGARVYGGMQIFTSQGTEEGYALFSGDAADVWTTDGSTGGYVRMQSDPATPPAGSSSGLAPQYRLWMDFKEAGSVTIRLKDPTIYKV